LAAASVGCLAGLVGAAFHAVLDQADRSRGDLRTALEAAPGPGWLVLMALCALALVTALWIVRRFAPEAAGSGIQEVEALLAGQRTLRWRRILPVKFVAGSLAVGSGLVLGREGPTVHMGAAVGQMASERMALDDRRRRSLVAAGAAAGLAAAFNAPLAAIVFVTEELREHFEYSFAAIQSVILACCAAVVVNGWILGQGPDLPVPHLETAPLSAVPLFLILGLLIGVLGVVFNSLLLASVRSFRALRPDQAYLAAGAVGMVLGGLLWFAPEAVGGGEALVESLPGAHAGLLTLLALIAVRLLTTVGSYGIGLPGGVFAPLLALGTIAGAAFSEMVTASAPSLALEPGVFAVAAMGALFAATVRAPLTGIILVIELTGAQMLALPIILTCLTATFTAEAVGGRPIYSLLLGLGERPAPRAPVRRIIAAGMILVAVILVDRMIPVERDQDRIAATLPGPKDEPPTARTPRIDIGTAPTPEVAADSPAVSTSGHGAVAPNPNPEPEAKRETPSMGEPPALGGRFSIQLISFRKAGSLAPFAERRGVLDQARTLDPGVSGWYPVLIGVFESRDAATAARDALPAELLELMPIIRELSPSQHLLPLPSAD
jgi:H+/Cl- antiporter ClcA